MRLLTKFTSPKNFFLLQNIETKVLYPCPRQKNPRCLIGIRKKFLNQWDLVWQFFFLRAILIFDLYYREIGEKKISEPKCPNLIGIRIFGEDQWEAGYFFYTRILVQYQILNTFIYIASLYMNNYILIQSSIKSLFRKGRFRFYDVAKEGKMDRAWHFIAGRGGG